MDSSLDRGVLGVQAEGVEPHRMQDVIALHPHEPGVGVRARHGVPVADVEVARRVRVHGELVPLRARVVVPDLVEPVRVPAVLPLRLYLGVAVAPLRSPCRCGHPYTPSCDPGTAKNKRPRPCEGRGLTRGTTLVPRMLGALYGDNGASRPTLPCHSRPLLHVIAAKAGIHVARRETSVQAGCSGASSRASLRRAPTIPGSLRPMRPLLLPVSADCISCPSTLARMAGRRQGDRQTG